MDARDFLGKRVRFEKNDGTRHLTYEGNVVHVMPKGTPVSLAEVNRWYNGPPKKYVRAMMEAHERDRVVVRVENGNFVFHYPLLGAQQHLAVIEQRLSVWEWLRTEPL